MKKLIVSCKTADQVFNDFKKAARKAQRGKVHGEPEIEVSFDSRADFNRFVRNIPVLSAIIVSKPKSVYELAKTTGIDVSNLNKIIDFFQEVGVLKVKTATVSGRKGKQPHGEYGEITFRLAA